MIEFRALGPVELTGTDGRALDAVLAQPKRLALLAYLAIADPPQFRRRDTIIAYLWPELDADHARAALRQGVHFLRQSLGATVVVSRGEEEVGVDGAQLWCDAVAFDRACADGQPSRALAFYRGELLPGFFVAGAASEFEHWLESERERLRRKASAGAWSAAGQAAAAGEQTAAGQFARQAAELAPDDEDTLRRLITVLDQLGDRSGAVRAYEDFARRLAREYSVEPSVETKALIEAVRLRAHRDVPLPATSSSMPSNRERLEDLFELERHVGRTGMATVYQARDIRHDRRVILKVLHRSLAAVLGPERFRREIHILAQLQHPGIHALYDSGEVDGALYYVMPYLEGESLRSRLARDSRVAVPGAVSIACDVAGALTYAHARGVILRDLKPDSILLVDGRAIVTDFGIARAISRAVGDRLTEAGIVLGTPAYMSPEQAAGTDELDERTDLYSLGCVVHEMLSGAPPYTAPTRAAVIAKHLSASVPRLSALDASVPGALADVVSKALAKSPDDRYATAADFATALRAAGRPLGQGRRPTLGRRGDSEPPRIG